VRPVSKTSEHLLRLSARQPNPRIAVKCTRGGRVVKNCGSGKGVKGVAVTGESPIACDVAPSRHKLRALRLRRLPRSPQAAASQKGGCQAAAGADSWDSEGQNTRRW
jgi:hypothetical protein